LENVKTNMAVVSIGNCSAVQQQHIIAREEDFVCQKLNKFAREVTFFLPRSSRQYTVSIGTAYLRYCSHL